eukprot:Phypoly_transcript_12042.p1 GENE.Phypoly_transcript_12042~~Phypoly_transcript_12042.p1  ORF type:complete len:386 (+),score=67.65 Phypoly_transcript_12042:77-1159(+)
MRIVIPGGSGQVGTILARHFHSSGHHVTILSRSAQADYKEADYSQDYESSATWRTVRWDARTLGTWCECLEGADAVINLSGRTVNCRYTAQHRSEIIDSRVVPTQLLGEAIARAKRPPAVWLNAGTATFYRDAYDRAQDEFTGELGGNEPNVPDTWHFSIDVARKWEEAFNSCHTPSTRKVMLRSAMVMSPDPGGVFSVFSWLVRMGLGGKNGSGKQYISWIHGEDFARAIEFLIASPDIEGVVNVTSPNPVPNCDFLRTLRKAWGVPFGLPATEWMLEIGAVFLRTETELILKSRRVVPGILLQKKFVFRFPDWEEAALDLVNKCRAIEAQRTFVKRLWPFWIIVYFFLAVVLLYYLTR